MEGYTQHFGGKHHCITWLKKVHKKMAFLPKNALSKPNNKCVKQVIISDSKMWPSRSVGRNVIDWLLEPSRTGHYHKAM